MNLNSTSLLINYFISFLIRYCSAQLKMVTNLISSAGDLYNCLNNCDWLIDFSALDTHRRSMPNLVTRNAQPGIRSHPSDSRLGSKLTPNRTKGTSPSRMARPSQPVTNHLQPRHQSPGRTLSPQRSGIPNPRSTGIPRPGSASKLPTPRK